MKYRYYCYGIVIKMTNNMFCLKEKRPFISFAKGLCFLVN